jgi:hypothetical protein
MSVQKHNLEIFLNFCKSLVNVHIKWISDPEAYRRETTATTVEDFLTDCGRFFNLETYKKNAAHPACVQLKDLYEALRSYYSDKTVCDYFSPIDPQWTRIQTIARRTQESLNVLIKEKEQHE